MFQAPKLPPEHRILRMRGYEDQLARMQAFVKEDQRLGRLAQWEQDTDVMVEETQVQARFATLRAQRSSGIEQRRQKLAALLAEEDAANARAIANSQETPEQKRARLGARARQLAAKREAERQALADELMARQFKESCDPLREKITRATVVRTAEERYAQIEQHAAERAYAEEEKRLWHEVNELERLKKDQRYMDDARKVEEQKADMQRNLDEHMRCIQTRQAQESAELSQWRRDFKAWCDAQDKEAADLAEAERQRNKRINKEVAEWNMIKEAQLGEAERAERMADFHMLNEALAREAAEEAREMEMRVKRKEEMRRYRAQLAVMAIKEKENASELDNFVNAYNALKMKEQDEEWERRAEARRQLWQLVDRTRQEQLAYKAALAERAAEEKVAEKVSLNADIARYQVEKASAEVGTYRRNKVQQLEIQAQIAARAAGRAVAIDERRKEREDAAAAEAGYMAKVEHVFTTEQPQTYFGRPKVAWFY